MCVVGISPPAARLAVPEVIPPPVADPVDPADQPVTLAVMTGVLQSFSANMQQLVASSMEQYAAAQAARAAAAPVAAAQQQVLPVRNIPAPGNGRLVGGAQRLAPRVQTAMRVLGESGEMSPAELDTFQEALRLGIEVPTRPLHGVLGGGASSAPASALQREGLLPPRDSNDDLMAAMFRTLRKESQGHSTKATSFPSFAAFYLKFVASRTLGTDLADTDPDGHAFITWHVQMVTWVFSKYGWPVAQLYHSEVSKLYIDGLLDSSSYLESADFNAGRFEYAVHQASLYSVLLSKRAGSSSSSSSSSSRSSSSRSAPTIRGTEERAHASDTYCDFHNKYYSASLKHSSDTCVAKRRARSG